MKRIFIKNMIATCLITGAVTNINMIQAHAEWNKNSQNKWFWTENGQKSIGWKKIDGQWYYFSDNGEMITGWLKGNDGNWYYLLDSGAMAIGWFKDYSGDWYYFSGSGAMVTGWCKDYDGRWYYFNSNGTMATGWMKSYDGNWYYLKSNGAMATGWIEHNGGKYYLEDSGAMVTGKKIIDGKTHEFNSSGTLIKTESIENSSSFDKEENRTGYIATDSCPLNLRDQPSMNSNIIGSIPKGMEVVVIGKETNGFYKVEWDNTIGYISSSWVSFEKKNNFSSNSNNSTSNLKVPLGQARTSAPSRDNQYYYSDSNLFYKVKLSPPFTNSSGKPIVGNCTWYAWGRIWELTGQKPTDADFRGNAYEWWEANKRTGKYKYGTTPKVGAVPVWKSSLPNSGGCGHVAVVENIENGKVYISESSWHGSLFNYREIYNTNHLYGYIYIDEPNY